MNTTPVRSREQRRAMTIRSVVTGVGAPGTERFAYSVSAPLLPSGMIVAGIDPGLGGAVALLLDTVGPQDLAVWDTPTHALARGGKNKREVDVYQLAHILGDARIGHAFIEQVGAMPGQGVSGVFAFGKAYGIVIGVLAGRGIPMTFVAPRRWKTALGVPASKDGARARASQLLPGAAHHWPRVKDDGRAEAALIALWGLRSLQPIATGVVA